MSLGSWDGLYHWTSLNILDNSVGQWVQILLLILHLLQGANENGTWLCLLKKNKVQEMLLGGKTLMFRNSQFVIGSLLSHF